MKNHSLRSFGPLTELYFDRAQVFYAGINRKMFALKSCCSGIAMLLTFLLQDLGDRCLRPALHAFQYHLHLPGLL